MAQITSSSDYPARTNENGQTVYDGGITGEIIADLTDLYASSPSPTSDLIVNTLETTDSLTVNGTASFQDDVTIKPGKKIKSAVIINSADTVTVVTASGIQSSIINGGVSGGICSIGAYSYNSTILGGNNNSMVQASNAAIIGGQGNDLGAYAGQAVVVGGTNNTVSAYGYSSVIAGSNEGTIGNSTNCAIIGGGSGIGNGNTINGSLTNTVVIGGNNIVGAVSNTVYVPSLNVGTVATYADNSAAASLATGTVYKTATGELRIKY